MSKLNHTIVFISLLICSYTPCYSAFEPIQVQLQSPNEINSTLPAAYKYYLSVCAIFKDEAPYLKEWIEYYKLMGVQHFRLYNNDSEDNFLEILDPYIKNNEVVLINWTGGQGDWCNKVQGPAMLNAISALKGVSQWVAIIDIDEFILPTQDPDVKTFLSNYESYGGVVINWQNYGTSGVKEVPADKLMIEVLTKKAREQSWWNQQVKCIVRPECVDTTKQDWTPHLWCYTLGNYAVAPNKQPFTWGPIDISRIRINHYVHRTENYFNKHKLAKKERMERTLTAEYVQDWLKSCCEEEDRAIDRFVPALRKQYFGDENMR